MRGRGLNPFRVLLFGGILITGRCPVLDDPTLSGLGILYNERVIKTTSEFSIHKPYTRKISHAMIPGLLKRHEGHKFGLCPERASSLSTGRSPVSSQFLFCASHDKAKYHSIGRSPMSLNRKNIE